MSHVQSAWRARAIVNIMTRPFAAIMAARHGGALRTFSRPAGGAWSRGVGLGLALLLAVGGPARADDTQSQLDSRDPKVFKICKDQTYALCATASCFVQDGVSYCRCDIKSGDSISLPFTFGKDQNVCSTNAAGAANGYMVSTFSFPPSVAAPDGKQALYNCPATTAPYGASAQCDGGICFKSTAGQSFPGFDQPLGKDQIICSCPIAVTNPATAKAGFDIVGPYPCQETFFKNCSSPTATPKTGATLYVGAPTGAPEFLTHLLDGTVPQINRCRPAASSNPHAKAASTK